jgi:phosphoribosylanthranilate isomerase
VAQAEDGPLKVDAKICGLSSVETMAAALDAGADYVGLVLFPKSPRNVDFARAKALADQARGRAGVVALAVNPAPALLSVIAMDIRPDVVQLHGQESPADVAFVRESLLKAGLGQCKIWKAISVETAGDAALAFEYTSVVDLILFDAKAPKDAVLPGGNGHAFDWAMLDGVKGQMPFMLSGGLSAENVAQAIARTGAGGVDVSSGVESAPGVKDPEMIRRFLRTVNELR